MGSAALLTVVLTILPVSGGTLTPPKILIDGAAGNQFDPHVDLDLAAYSNAGTSTFGPVEEIRYYSFSTAVTGAIPNTLADGGLSRDMLSDVDQGRIVFTRFYDLAGSAGIVLFDVASGTQTELAPPVGTLRYGVALGSQTAVYVDYGLSTNGTGEVVLVNLGTNTTTRLTNDDVADQNPAVAPDGNTVTWDRCPISDANCDIYTATRSGSIWVIQQISSSLLRETSPDTNGTQVVFERETGGATGIDLVLAPVTGGAETVIELPGDQRNVSIRGQVVAFENRAVGASRSDIMILDLTTNRLFQVTDTPAINETLNDVTLLPTGEVRIVWQADDSADGTTNIYGSTFSLPAAPVVDAGVPDAGVPTVDAGVPSCTPRSATLEATRFYAPSRWVDGTASFAPALQFTIPATLPVVQGASAHGWASLSFVSGNKTTTCIYRGGPTAAVYSFFRCSQSTGNGGGGHDDDDDDDDDHDGHGHCGGNGNGNGNGHGRHYTPAPHAGSLVSATNLKLHVQNGDRSLGGLVRVRLVLTEAGTCSTSTHPLEAGAPEGPQAAGCSSSGGTLAPMLAMLFFAAMLLRRPAAIRLVARQGRRTLPR
jgi:Tol biopolymer transport system component